MKKILFTSALLVSGIASAAAPIDGWYGGVFGGYAYLPNNLSTGKGGLIRNHAEYQSGYNAGGSFGYKSAPLRYEGELTYINADLERFRVNGTTQTGVTGFNQVGLAIANIYYDCPEIITTIEPFLGIGIGYAYVDGSFKSTGPSGITRFNQSNTVFAYQGTAGLTYNFAEAWALNIGYRYVATNRVHNFGKMFQANLANVGAVYRFDENKYK
jgi:opacity protein-like surface antigen